MAERQDKSKRSGTAVLVACALSKIAPKASPAAVAQAPAPPADVTEPEAAPAAAPAPFATEAVKTEPEVVLAPAAAAPVLPVTGVATAEPEATLAPAIAPASPATEAAVAVPEAQISATPALEPVPTETVAPAPVMAPVGGPASPTAELQVAHAVAEASAIDPAPAPTVRDNHSAARAVAEVPAVSSAPAKAPEAARAVAEVPAVSSAPAKAPEAPATASGPAQAIEGRRAWTAVSATSQPAPAEPRSAPAADAVSAAPAHGSHALTALAQISSSSSRAGPSACPTPTPASSVGSSATAEAPVQKRKSEHRRYTLDEFTSVDDNIGSGSYGAVAKVVHKTTKEVFAMKAIPKKKVLEHQMEAYLKREVKTQLQIQHPNILRLHYYFEDAQSVYLLLEFAASGSLFSLLRKRGRLPEDEAARIFLDISSALHHIHRSGVVHRDLKPENILMCGNVAKLADFGWCAELSKDGESRHTFCGTWDYLSPEMVQNEPHDHTVDVWAMGVLLYEMLTGRPPFAAHNQMRAMDRITRVDLRVPDSISAAATDLIGRILVRDKERRVSLPDAVKHTWVRRFIPDAEIVPGKIAAGGEGGAGRRDAAQQPQQQQAPQVPAKQAGASGDAAAREQAKAKLAAIQQQLAEVKDKTIQQHRQQQCDNARIKPTLAPLSESSQTSPAPATPVSGALIYSAVTPASSSGTASKLGEIGGRHADAIRQNLGTEGSPAFTEPASSATPQSDIDSSCRSSPSSAAHRKGELLQGAATPWQDTDTFAAIRKWCRKSSAVTAGLGEELDKTLPLGATSDLQMPHAEGDDAVRRRSKTSSMDEAEGAQALLTRSNTERVSTSRMVPEPKKRASLSDRRKRKDSPLRVEERDGHAQSLSPIRLRPGLGAASEDGKPAAASTPADDFTQPRERMGGIVSVEDGKPAAASAPFDEYAQRREMLEQAVGGDACAEANATGFDAADQAAGFTRRTSSGSVIEERTSAADRAAGDGTQTVAETDALGNPVGKGWADMKNDLDTMTDAFRGQLDRLMRQLEGSKSQ